MIRKGKLHRICAYCEKKFEPKGKFQQYCFDCIDNLQKKAGTKRKKTASSVQKRHLDFVSRIRNTGGTTS